MKKYMPAIINSLRPHTLTLKPSTLIHFSKILPTTRLILKELSFFYSMNIGLAIRSIRKNLGMAQWDLAERCSISQTSLSQVETGLKKPSYKTLTRVCGALDIPLSVIYLVAMEEGDVPANKKGIFQLVYPSMKSLAMQIVNPEKYSATAM